MKTIRHLFKNSLLLLLPLLFGVSALQGQTTVTIGTGTLTAAGTNGTPIYRSSTTSSFHHSKSVQLLTAAQMSTAGIPVGAFINNIGYNKTNNGTPSGANAFVLNVYLKNSSATTLATGTAWSTMISGATLAYTQTITSANMPSATGYWMWPCSGFAYTGGALEVYIEWYPSGTMTSPFSTNTFSWEYTASGNQAMGTSASAAIAGTNTAYTAQARFYNTRITYTPAAACSGAPTGGTTQANATSTTFGACPTSAVSLSVTGGTAASGLTYQWQYSASGSGYADISGATSAGYSIASLASGDVGYYQRVETCTASGQSTPSTPVQVTQNNFMTCYCIPTFSSATVDEDIYNVTVGTLNNTSTCSLLGPGAGSVAGGYANYKSGAGAPATADIAMGAATSFSVKVGFCGTSTYSNGIAIWIDTNQNGTFETGERYYYSSAIRTTDISGATAGTAGTVGAAQTVANGRIESGTFIIPTTALAGVTAMRVMASETAVPSAACTTPSGYGEAEDYLVNILCPTPTALTATAITSSSATLGWASSSTNFDIEYGANGFSQGTGTFATSATNSLAITGLTPSTGYDFYVRTNCGSGNYGPWAGPYTFTSGSALDIAVSAVTVVDNCQANGTSDITVLVSNVGLTDVNPGDVSLTLTIDSNGAAGGSNTATILAGGTETVTFTGVSLGTAASMVFGVTATTLGDANAANDAAGTTQIIGIANAGTATTTASGSICPSVTFNLGLTGVSTSTSTTYQWEKSTDNGATWSNLAGATTATLTGRTQSVTTIYRCVLTCGTNTLTSTDITVTTNPFYNCYCIPTFTSATADEDIYNVTVGTLNNTSTCNLLGPGAGSVAGGYANYKSGAGAPATADIAMGAATSFSVKVGFCGTSTYSNGIAIWIDTNQNGAFETGERYYYSSGALTTDITGGTAGTAGTAGAAQTLANGRIESGTFIIPTTALAGITAMRVTALESGVPSAGCTGGGYGETEDYLVNILCPTPTALTATGLTATGATLGWTSSSTNFDIEYGTTGFTQGAGTPATSATNSLAITSLTASTGYDFYVRTNCGGGAYSTWAGPYPFTTGSPLDVAISAVTVVDKCEANGTSDVTVMITNVGTTDVNAGEVSLALTIDGNGAASASNMGTILAAGTETVTFTGVSLGAAASMIFGVTATTAGDANAANDVASATEVIGIVNVGTATTTASGAICPAVTFDLGLGGVSASASTTYQWVKSTDNGSTWSNLSGGTTATVTALTQSATTIYHCVLTCGGTTMTSSDVTVTTNPFYNCYCTTSYSSCSGDGIVNVSLNSISYPSAGCPGAPNSNSYYSYASPMTSLSVGSSYTVSVTLQTDPNQFTSAWIDYNQDGNFDATEIVGAISNPGASGTYTATFVVPSNALTGITKMRVKGGVDAAFTAAQACGANMGSTYGEVEDYFIGIVCPTPTALTATSIELSSATLGWTSNLSSFDVEYGVTGFTQGTGTATTSATTSKAITGLTLGTSYDFYVRTNCSSNSTWAGPYTFSTLCAPNANTTIPTTAGSTLYATNSCLDVATGWTYFYNGTTLLLGVEMGAWNPGTLAQTTPGAGQYAVRVDVGASMIADLTTAPYNDSTNGGYGSGKPWKVVNRTWDLQLFATAQEPSDSINVKTYFTEAEYQAVNGDLLNLADKLTSPSQMTIYKLRRVSQPWANLYATSMAALTAAHAGLDSSKISLYNNLTTYLTHWTYSGNNPATGIHTAELKVAEFSGGGGGGGAGGGSPFAVELAYFDGHNQGSYNLLNWVTISELSNKAFEVQRSVDGISFQTIGTVNTKAVNGTSSNTISYEFADLKPAKNSYYRLKQIDIDGSVNMLPKVVEISLADNFKTSINLFPNPASSELNVAITGSTFDTYLVEVSDIYGRTVASTQQLSNGGTTISTINVKDLAQGTYIVTVKDRTNSIVSTQRFIKE